MKKFVLVVLTLIITASCSTIREGRERREKLQDLELQIRDIQRSNVMLQNRVEELERKMYLLNLMQDKIESLSLKLDEVSQSLKGLQVGQVTKSVKFNKSQPVIPRENPSVQQVSPPQIPEQKSNLTVSSPSVSTAEGEEESESPIPVNPKLDLRGVDATSPENIYRKAMEYLKEKNYDKASALFLYLVQSYPDSDLADNALYWTGECYYATHNYEDSIKYFNEVIQKYPDGNKVPDSMLKIGFAYLKMGNIQKAKEYLKLVVNNYPWSHPAKLAREKLKEINGG